jgi:hypothetical protein
MKRILVIAAVFSMAGCAAALPAALDTLVSVAKPAAATSDKVVVEGTRGLILAHNAAQAGMALVTPLVRNRALSPGQVDRYEFLVNEVEKYAVTGRTTLTVAERAAMLFNIADEFNLMKESTDGVR